MHPLTLLADWPVANAAASVIHPDGTLSTHGDVDRVYELASVTKVLTAAAVLVAHDEGTIDLDAPIDHLDGATGADLLAHSAGLGPDAATPRTTPGRRRIYSNLGYETVAELVGAGAGFPFTDYLTDAVIEPLGLTHTSLPGSPAAGARASVDDLVRFVVALRDRTLLSPEATRRLQTVHRPDLSGVLPGYGRQQPNPWGQGPEIRGAKHPHWTGDANTPATWGHFGQSGTFVWHDPGVDVSLVVLTDEPFGEWARPRWPQLADAVLDAAS